MWIMIVRKHANTRKQKRGDLCCLAAAQCLARPAPSSQDLQECGALHCGSAVGCDEPEQLAIEHSPGLGSQGGGPGRASDADFGGGGGLGARPRCAGWQSEGRCLLEAGHMPQTIFFRKKEHDTNCNQLLFSKAAATFPENKFVAAAWSKVDGGLQLYAEQNMYAEAKSALAALAVDTHWWKAEETFFCDQAEHKTVNMNMFLF